MPEEKKTLEEQIARVDVLMKEWEKEDGISYIDLVTKLEAGDISVDMNGHNLISFDKEKAVKEIIKDMVSNLQRKKNTFNSLPGNCISAGNLHSPIGIGQFTNCDLHCYDCGSSIYPILTSNDTLTFLTSKQFWDNSKKGSGVVDLHTIKDNQCSAYKLLGNEKKLTVEIDVPSGNLIFANYFTNEETYKHKDHTSINEISGRYGLMKHLASKNIGYGQMGNMSINVYSNNKNEVIIGGGLECYEDNSAYYEEYPEKKTDSWKKEVADAESLKNIIKDNNHKDFGSISLDVWRWQCGDKGILEKEFGEKFPDKMKKNKNSIYEEFIWITVDPGIWVIEHYFDFPQNGEYLYSKIFKK